MILKNTKTDNGWTTLTYQSTWRFYYEIMLCAAEEIIDFDFKERLGRLAVQDPGAKEIECLDEYQSNGKNIRQCKTLAKEHGSIIISGFSSIMESPIQFTFYNQSNVVTLQTNNLKLIEQYGSDVFTNYMNSVEIKTYVRDTKNDCQIKQMPFGKRLKLLFGK